MESQMAASRATGVPASRAEVERGGRPGVPKTDRPPSSTPRVDDGRPARMMRNSPFTVAVETSVEYTTAVDPPFNTPLTSR